MHISAVDDLPLPTETEDSDVVDVDGFWLRVRKDKLVTGLLKGTVTVVSNSFAFAQCVRIMTSVHDITYMRNHCLVDIRYLQSEKSKPAISNWKVQTSYLQMLCSK